MSHHDIALSLKDAIAMQAGRTNIDRAFLLEQLKLIEETLKPLQTDLEFCNE